jgi:hypothetical protein
MEMPPMTTRDYDRLLEAKEAWHEQNDREKDAKLEDLKRKIKQSDSLLGQKDVQNENLRKLVFDIDKLSTSLIIPLARRFPTWNLTIGRFAGTKMIPEAVAVHITSRENMRGILVWNAESPGGYLATIYGTPHDLVDWTCDARKFESLEDLYDALANLYDRLW